MWAISRWILSMQDFKKNIKNVIRPVIFILILFLLLVLSSGWISEASKKDDSLIQARNKNIVNIQKESENSIDVLFLGDSLGYTSFSPMQIWENQGITSFAGCQSSQKIQESYYMLKTALEQQKPKVVVLETNVVFRDQKGLDGIKDTLAEKFIYYLPLFRFHDIWKPLLMGNQYIEDNYKGFMIRKSVAAYSGKPYMDGNEDKRQITDVVKSYLEEIHTMCEENGAKLVFVSVPSPVNYNKRKHNSLKEYTEENNIPYVDLNLKVDELRIDWEQDSLDKGDHLNLSGAKKVTAFMEKYLKENFDLADHRGESGYEDWNRQSREYDLKVQ